LQTVPQPTDGPLLVILDDCDRVLGRSAEVGRALLGLGVLVIASAREPLRLEGEHVWRLSPLSVPAQGRDGLSELLMESDAAQLFCERAAAAARRFLPTAETASAVADICRLLDGVPLAIELAAWAASVYSPTEISARLTNAFSLLTAGPRDGHVRQRTLRDCLAWSYDVLPPEEQSLLARVSVFPASFSEGAVVAVCARPEMADVEAAVALRALVDKSLVEVELAASGTRYRLLNMLRWFGREKLAARGDEEATRDGHARWCAASVRAAGHPRQTRRWLASVDAYSEDVRVAADWALVRGPVETAFVLVDADVRLCRAQGRHREGRERIKELAATTVAGPPVLRSRALAQAGMAAAADGFIEQARNLLGEAATVAEEAACRGEATTARIWLAFFGVAAGNPCDLASIEAAVADASALAVEDAHVVVDALVALGRARLLLGLPAAAFDAFTESAALATANGDEVGRTLARAGRAAAGVVLGRYRDAEVELGDVVASARAAGEGETATSALLWLGEAALLRGRNDESQSWFLEALDAASAIEHPGNKARATLGLGRLALERGDDATATETFDRALAAARSSSTADVVVSGLCGLARLADDPIVAHTLATEALGTARRAGDPAGEALACEHLAFLANAQGDATTSANRHHRALVLRAKIGDPAAIADSFDALAILAAGRQRGDVAARLIGAAEGLRGRTGSARARSRQPELAAAAERVRREFGDHAFVAERRYGARLSLPAAVEYALAHAAKRVPRPSKGWEALTAAERRAAALAIAGRTNVDIARELGMRPATVKTHLRSVFAKVGVENRTTLAAVCQQQRAGELEPSRAGLDEDPGADE
jgi:predicted ATPase/DNA-binding CsgD family transcriptional regulator